MNILLETGLPQEIDGTPIYADYRNMIRFEQILADETLSDMEKAQAGLAQLYDALPPGGVQHAINRLIWFYTCGDVPKHEKKGRSPDRAYHFDQDARYIYAGFYAAYGISLTTVKFLHWWEFMALLESLPETTLMGQIMRWRTMDLSQIKDKNSRAYYADLKRRFALKGNGTRTRGKSVEEITRQNQERVAKRFAEAQEKKAAALRDGL